VRWGDLPTLALLGFLGVTLHQWLQATGLKTASATVGSWIVATIPVFVAILGWIFLKERLGRKRIVGIAIATIGAMFVVGQGNPLNLIRDKVGTEGDILFVLSAINWAIFTVLSRRVLRQKSVRDRDSFNETERILHSETNHPLAKMMYVMGFGWLFSLVWFAIDGRISDFSNLSGEYLWSILFLGVACSGFAYIFWYEALAVVGATQTGVFLYFEPIVTALLAWPILGEVMSLGAVLGGVAILFGVWLVSRN
jgi:drug/metabolite transporter (DMT)-like permease